MTKHILDRSRPVTKDGLEQALATERQAGPQQATLALQRRRRARAQALRVRHFLRFARGVRP